MFTLTEYLPNYLEFMKIALFYFAHRFHDAQIFLNFGDELWHDEVNTKECR